MHLFCITAYAKKVNMAALRFCLKLTLMIGITLVCKTYQSPAVGGDRTLKSSKEAQSEIEEGSGNLEAEEAFVAYNTGTELSIKMLV